LAKRGHTPKQKTDRQGAGTRGQAKANQKTKKRPGVGLEKKSKKTKEVTAKMATANVRGC